ITHIRRLRFHAEAFQRFVKRGNTVDHATLDKSLGVVDSTLAESVLDLAGRRAAPVGHGRDKVLILTIYAVLDVRQRLLGEGLGWPASGAICLVYGVLRSIKSRIASRCRRSIDSASALMRSKPASSRRDPSASIKPSHSKPSLFRTSI